MPFAIGILRGRDAFRKIRNLFCWSSREQRQREENWCLFWYFPAAVSYIPTIHKNDVCLTQKYPKLWDTLPSLVFHGESKYLINFEIEITFHAIFQFFKNLTHIFLFIFHYFCNCGNFRQESRNLKCDVFVFITSNVLFVNRRRLRGKNHSKWKMEAIWRPLN